MERVTTISELRAVLGDPAPTTPRKIHTRLNDRAAAFVAKSPLVFLATAGAEGQPTVSPKGGKPGFVRVVGPNTLHIPERKGNRLLVSFQNLLGNPRLGLLFAVPGTAETLRVHGTGALLTDPALCQAYASHGRPALLVLAVTAAECYFHCGKALLRSAAWDPSTWPERIPVSFGSEIAEGLGLADGAGFVAEFDRGVAERYQTDL